MPNAEPSITLNREVDVARRTDVRRMLNKVPEVAVAFWIISRSITSTRWRVRRGTGWRSCSPSPSAPPDEGGLGLGTTVTSVIFLVAILAVVVVMSVQQQTEASVNRAVS